MNEKITKKKRLTHRERERDNENRINGELTKKERQHEKAFC